MLLRADMTLRSWRRVARVVWVVESWSRGSRFPELQLGDAHGVREHSREKNGLFILRPSMDAPHCLFYDYRKLAATTPDSQLPTVTTQDLVAGRVVPGVDTPRFNALLWRSPIPPYCSYVITCEIDGNQQTAASSAREQLGRRPGEILELERLKKKRLADEPS
uniref:Uncharacterized protein n=1 Tax=Oryza brachyantha TaxID=4533 RepID=J3KYE5_ORYBR